MVANMLLHRSRMREVGEEKKEAEEEAEDSPSSDHMMMSSGNSLKLPRSGNQQIPRFLQDSLHSHGQ